MDSPVTTLRHIIWHLDTEVGTASKGTCFEAMFHGACLLHVWRRDEAQWNPYVFGHVLSAFRLRTEYTKPTERDAIEMKKLIGMIHAPESDGMS